MTSDTPRTDKEIFFDGMEHPAGYWVDSDFARRLERELIRITWERDALLQSMDLIASGYGSEVTAQRTLEELARMRSTYEDEGGRGE